MSQEFRNLRGAEVQKLLDQCCAERTLLQILINGEPPPCVSRVHSIFHQINRMDIESFGVGELDRAMAPGTPLEVTMTCAHLPYRFYTRCVGESVGTRFHLLALPPSIEAIQRRSYYRVAPPRLDSLTMSVAYAPEEEPHSVSVVNFSVGGAMIYDPTLSEPPEPNGTLRLSLLFDRAQRMALEARIRRAMPLSEKKTGLLVATHFESLSPNEEMALGVIVMRWQREILRSSLDE